jgi:hypothetical protein
MKRTICVGDKSKSIYRSFVIQFDRASLRRAVVEELGGREHVYIVTTELCQNSHQSIFRRTKFTKLEYQSYEKLL